MAIESTLTIFNASEIEKIQGYVKEHQRQPLIGNKEHPSERIFVSRATFEAGAFSPFHWHPIEVLYYVISGRAIVNDIEGNRREMTAGSVLYAPAGIAGSHEWEVKETMQLLSIRATTDHTRLIQFSVDKSSKESSMTFKDLTRSIGYRFASFY